MKETFLYDCAGEELVVPPGKNIPHHYGVAGAVPVVEENFPHYYGNVQIASGCLPYKSGDEVLSQYRVKSCAYERGGKGTIVVQNHVFLVALDGIPVLTAEEHAVMKVEDTWLYKAVAMDECARNQ